MGAVSALILVITSAGLASASSVDTAVVDTTAPTGSVSLEAGQNATIQINMTVAGAQAGTATFQINRNWSLVGGTFTGSNPETFTVLPRVGGDPSLTLSTSGTISAASGQALGNFTLAIGAFGITNSNSTGGKLAAGASSNYAVQIVSPSDSTRPVITSNVTGTVNNGWYTSDVSVSWIVTDAQSAVTSSTGCGGTTISTDTTSMTLTCSATSGGGTASQSISIKRDATAPTLTATPTPGPNLAGYNNSSVDVTYICSDATSDLATPCPATDHATTDGTHAFDHAIFDNAGNSSSVSTTVNLDATKPTIIGSRTLANGAGWNNSDVTVTFTCTDTGTGASGVKSCVADGTSLDHKTLSTQGADQSVSGTATDNADNTNTATVGGIKIDKTLPVITLASRTQANIHGWNNTGVTLTWNCTDLGGSGVVHETVTQTRTEDGAGQTATGICMDLAGNSASDTQSGINIDQTAPVITYNNRAPGANPALWNNTAVTVNWQCSDSVSDVVHAAVSEAVSTEGLNQSATGTCEDLAGNTASDTQSGINIDKTAPGVVYTSASPGANPAGWNKTDVIATFTATDSLSGFAGPSPTTTGTATTIGEGIGLTVSSPAFTDLAGNTTAAGAATSDPFNIDLTNPVASFDSSIGSVYFGSVPAPPNCTSTDGGSGPDGCTVTGYSTAVGAHTLTATALDLAGRTGTATQTYNVLAWTLKGFYQPVDINGVLNTVKGGSTVPLKFEVFAGATELTSTSAAVLSFNTQLVSCSNGSGIEDAIEILSTGGTSLRYDSTGGQFIQNWKTPTGAGKCYSATMTTLDGSSITALFKLK